MSKERSNRLNYEFFRNCIEKVPVAPMQMEWFDEINCLIPNQLKSSPSMQQTLDELFDEIKNEFDRSMKAITSMYFTDSMYVIHSSSSLNKKASGAQCFIMALGLFWDIVTGLP